MTSGTEGGAEGWVARLLVIPGLAWLGVFALTLWTRWDVALADRFYDPATATWPAARSWWADLVLHTYGKRALLAIALGLLVILVLGTTRRFRARLLPWRRFAGFVVIVGVLVPGLVGSLKKVSSVPCPQDLDRYGGDFPDLPLWQLDRPALPRGGCFPAAHSSGAFALLAFALAWRQARPDLSRLAVVVALALGVAFAIGQTARGSHFFSHDLVSLAIAWLLAVGLWAGPFGRRVHPRDR
jgi:membrane-associated PAP2 superfamily phosphatase